MDKHSLDGETAVRLCNYTDVYKNAVIQGSMPFMEATATTAEIERFSILPGDVVMTKDSETPEDIGVAALVDVSAKGVVCAYHLALLRPRGEMLGDFLTWALRSREVTAQFTVRAQGVTRFGLTTSGMGNVWLPAPTLSEQHAIAAFLDRETAKIDALVAEQERLLVLLAEKRQVAITRGIAQGLDPLKPMVESGLGWLGSVPAHWRIAPIRYYASVGNGSTPSKDNLGYWDSGDVAWVASGEVNQYHVTEPTDYVTTLAVAECGLRILPQGAVLVGLVGQGRTRAMSAILRIPAAINLECRRSDDQGRSAT